MTRFLFSLRNTNQVRQAGVVQSESFTEALTAISGHVTAREGDTLEIGVTGFPPAKYECIWSLDQGSNGWRPTGQRAA